MPEERDIERQLRDYAEQRRKDAGERFEMHPVNRRQLQSEQQRVLGEKAPATPAPKPSLFRGFWPKLAWGVSMLTVLGMGTWAFLRSQPATPSRTLAVKTETAGYVQQLAKAEAQPVPAKPQSPQPASPPKAVFARDRVPMESRPASPASPAPLAAAEPKPKPAAPVVTAPTTPAANSSELFLASAKLRKDADKARANRGLASDSTREADSTGSALVANGLAPQSQVAQAARNSWQFNNFVPTQSAAGAKADRRTANAVLNNFNVEQNDNQIRIVDKDGSIYSGTLIADLRDAKTPAKKTIPDAPAGTTTYNEAAKELAQAIEDVENPEPPVQVYRILASGTNLTLRQKVTINGEIVPPTNAPAEPVAYSNQQLRNTVQSGLLFSNSRIVGGATTADGQRVELNATQAKPK